MNPYPRGFPGVQIHAVPEGEKAVDASGRKLPWAYDTTLPASQAVEKGPFGRSMRRSRSGASRSRSKTAEPRREEEKLKAEQVAAEDAVFGSLRKVMREEGRIREREALGDVDASGVVRPSQTTASTARAMESDQEATEVLLYGFAPETQWAAIDFYERVSSGSILEDYERAPPAQRYDISRSFGRAASLRSLSKAALRKKNRHAGGVHWIKVTYDSREAAELACARSPHILKGHLVYAEPWQGRGPGKDEPILASQAGAQITSRSMPSTFSTNAVNASPNGSSTITSATATAPRRADHQAQTQATGNTLASVTSSSITLPGAPHSTTTMGSQLQPLIPNYSNRGRIEGATRAVLLPAEQALMPKPPKQSWTAWLGGSELIGTTVPRKEDGSFDWERSSLYWKLWYWLDGLMGTDFCGSKEE